MLLAAQTRRGSGHEILLEAAGLLSRSGLAGVKFILACDRDENSALECGIDRAIATEWLQGIIYRTGHCDMFAALLAASIVVVPATEARAFGDAAVQAQAQAMETPVIAANLAAAPETVLAPPIVEESSRTGFLVPPAARRRAMIATVFSVPDAGSMARAWASSSFASRQAISSLTSRSNQPMFYPGQAIVVKIILIRARCRVRFVHMRSISHSPSNEGPPRSAEGRAAHKP